MTTGIAGARLLRISTFRLLGDEARVQRELRELGRYGADVTYWIGRRLLDDPAGPEIVVVSLWPTAEEMERRVGARQGLISPEHRAAARAGTTSVYAIRAYGSWTRDRKPCLIRIFTGSVVDGDPSEFDDRAAEEYLSFFEPNLRCASIAAAIGEDGGVMLMSLWTSWDAVVTATAGDLRQVLPIRLPGYAVAGSAVHYEIIVADET